MLSTMQGGMAWAVIDNITDPAATSATEGVYVGARVVVFKNVPVPVVDHDTDAAWVEVASGTV